MLVTKKIIIRGIVQGVGFRPFIYNASLRYKIYGEVYNDGNGVILIAQSDSDNLKAFIVFLQSNYPNLAKVESLEVLEYNAGFQYNNFRISSSKVNEINTNILPDVSTCSSCLEEINDYQNQRYSYPFTNCINCGPRFSIITKLPYDRQNTSMSHFQMCKLCEGEYHNHTDKRFHAQPNACPACGPSLELVDNNYNKVGCNDIITKASLLMQEGNILAIKGIGGFHIALIATNVDGIKRVRILKNRPYKAFALMAKDIETVEKYCIVSNEEKSLLTNNASPIVLLEKSNNSLPDCISPKQNKLGFMLPYSPLHHLLCEKLQVPIILSSANKNSNPQITQNEKVINELHDICDYFVIHNRDIVNRLDDSVVQVINNKPRMIRRARGYSPVTLKIPDGFNCTKNILGTGAELKNTFCLATKDKVVISQHIGDLKNLESYEDFTKNIALYKDIYNIKLDTLACDMHPNYLSSQYAHKYSIKDNISIKQVQHHHAHIAACLFEHQRAVNTPKVLGIVWDGSGLGIDNKIWGGEFLLSDYSSFERIAHFEYIELLGGDKANEQPWRMAFAYLKRHKIDIDKLFDNKPIKALNKVLDNSLDITLTSSVGRLFDAVAYMLNICKGSISYEGQAALELEALATQCDKKKEQIGYNFDINSSSKPIIISTKSMWQALKEDLKAKSNVEIAYKFHMGLAKLIHNLSVILSSRYGFDTVVMSGGVFHNKLLTTLSQKELGSSGFKTLLPMQFPAGDGGLSLGQAAVAMACECIKPK